MCLIRVDVGKFKFSFAASGLLAEYKLKNATKNVILLKRRSVFLMTDFFQMLQILIINDVYHRTIECSKKRNENNNGIANDLKQDSNAVLELINLLFDSFVVKVNSINVFFCV